ncbi:hypothetical protein KKC32_01005 [Patescibacteria group bacterium]|nr:hypothetical protein [Patescibacteria group bacterium]
MENLYYKSSGGRAQTCKVVVSGNGHVVAKNYDPKTLREGDIGITMRLDGSENLEQMSAAQKEISLTASHAMARDVFASLGEAPDDTIFKPGTCWEFCSDNSSAEYGSVIRATKEGIQFLIWDFERGRFIEAFRSWKYDYNEIPDCVGQIEFVKFLLPFAERDEGFEKLIDFLPPSEDEYLIDWASKLESSNYSCYSTSWRLVLSHVKDSALIERLAFDSERFDWIARTRLITRVADEDKIYAYLRSLVDAKPENVFTLLKISSENLTNEDYIEEFVAKDLPLLQDDSLEMKANFHFGDWSDLCSYLVSKIHSQEKLKKLFSINELNIHLKEAILKKINDLELSWSMVFLGDSEMAVIALRHVRELDNNNPDIFSRRIVRAVLDKKMLMKNRKFLVSWLLMTEASALLKLPKKFKLPATIYKKLSASGIIED